MPTLLLLFLLLFLLVLATTSSQLLPISSKLDHLPITDRPFGTRLFLTSHPNFLNLAWTCCVKAEKSQFLSTTGINIFYDDETPEKVTRVANNPDEITARFKEIIEGEDCSTFVQLNTTLELKLNKTLLYRVSCEERQSVDLEVNYQYWDEDHDHPWSLLSVGSLGLYNTTKITLGTIKTISDNMKNALWTIPGGIVADRTALDHNNATKADLESWRNWLSWITLAENVTCCIPVAAAPSPMDLYPYNSTNQFQSNFRHFMELPFASSHEVLWYSFNHRNLHVVAICSSCDLSENSTQFKWLEEDLKEASASNDTHWTMLLGHDEIYDEASPQKPVTTARLQLDKLLDRYNVDFAVWSHERWYERTKPIRNFKVSDQRVSNSLHHVDGTIHYTCGTGGIPLQTYNMEKYKHAARFYASEYGVCSFHKVAKDVFDTMFLYTNTSSGLVTEYDFLQVSKKLYAPAVDLNNHFSKFMKMFGVVIVGGAALIMVVMVVLKVVQLHNPSIIVNKIRNIRWSKAAAGSNINMSCEQLEVDAEFPDSRDTVMLLEEEPVPDADLVTSAALYGITM